MNSKRVVRGGAWLAHRDFARCAVRYGNQPGNRRGLLGFRLIKQPSISGSGRVIRGGSWSNRAQYCRSAYRDGDQPSFRYDFLGFRLINKREKR